MLAPVAAPVVSELTAEPVAVLPPVLLLFLYKIKA